MNILSKVFQQTSWQVFGKASSSISTIIILGIVSRKFGESGTGVFTLALTFLSFLSLMVDFGINAHVVRYFVREDNLVIWRKLLGFRLLLAYLLILMAVVATYFWPDSSWQFKIAVWLGLFSVIGSAIVDNANLTFQSRLRYDLAFYASAVGSGVTLLGVIILSSKVTNVPWLIIAYDFGWLATGLLSLAYVYRYIRNLWPIFDLKYCLELLKTVWPISLTLILNVVYFRADSFILAIYKSYADVGQYNLAYQIFQSVLVLPTFVMNSYYPLMLKDFEESKIKFYRSIRYSMLVMLAISLVGILSTFILSHLVVRIVSGAHGFGNSAQLLNILSLGFPAFFLSSILMWTLVTYKRYKMMVSIYSIGLLFNLVSNSLLIPHYSYFAAAYTTVVSEYLILLVQIFMITWQVDRRIFRK